jgi:hypothetical protein
MRSARSGRTPPAPDKARDTVATDTPHACARSSSRIRRVALARLPVGVTRIRNPFLQKIYRLRKIFASPW